MALWAEAVQVSESEKSAVAFFDKNIHPVFESSCYECHGGDKVSSGLVMTNRASLIKGGNRGPGINLNDPESSILLKMINHTDEKLRMPMDKPALTQAQIDKFTDWVMMGAPYNPSREFKAKVTDGVIIDDKARSYWAYQLPQKPDVPTVESKFVKNAVDAFILEKLTEEGIQPNQPAELNMLVRRVYYDLTGLAPTKAEIDAFVAAYKSDQDWFDLVDRLLNSPHFGEKMATHWLDLVRYGETNGFERDSLKPQVWRYRDYVINAFNKNKPYDQFLIDQLAGDEIANRTLESSIATGFLTLMQRDDDPADVPQAHADMVSDMVDVTGEAFLGATMHCAKCHDHKGDPIRQADYYSMRAFFDGIEPNRIKRANGLWVDELERAKHKKRIRDASEAKAIAFRAIDRSLMQPYLQPSGQPEPMIPMSLGDRQEWEVASEVPKTTNWTFPSYDGSDLEKLKLPLVTNPLPKFGFSSKNSTIWNGHDKIVLRKTFGLTEIPERLFVYFQASSLKNLEIHLNGELIFNGALPNIDHNWYYVFDNKAISELTTGKNAISFVAEVANNRLYFDLGIYFEQKFKLTEISLVRHYPHIIRQIYGGETYEKLDLAVDHFIKARSPAKGQEYLTVREIKKLDKAFIHVRGNVHASGKEVPLAFPEVMVSSQKTAIPKIDPNFFEKNRSHGRRLALAKWITSEENPLTARVMVNRLWQYLFGKGIVTSSNDFGEFGEMPSNQALLDYLAVEFIESGWNIKHMLSLILNSSSYRLSTAYNEASFSLDPSNRWVWRHDARRLTAEEIRDSFLAVSGDLNLEAGGEPIRPKMPKGLLETASKPTKVWPETIGPQAKKRAVYIHVKRSIKLPILASHDSPERDMSCAARFTTTVPTQALTMLNSEFVNKCATDIASRIRETSKDIDEQIKMGVQLALSRDATQQELKELRSLSVDLHKTYGTSEEEVLNRLCLVILNLNEMIYLD